MRFFFLLIILYYSLLAEEYVSRVYSYDIGAYIGTASDIKKCPRFGKKIDVYDPTTHKCYLVNKYVSNKPLLSYNFNCIKRNKFSSFVLYEGLFYNRITCYKVSEISFCKNRKGYIYNENDNVWYPVNGDPDLQPVCPDGKVFDFDEEKCVDNKKSCSSAFKECSAKCGKSANIKYYKCKVIDNKLSYKCECATCKDLIKLAINNCSSKNMKVDNFSCSDKDGYIVSSTSDYLHLIGGDASFCLSNESNSSSNVVVNDKNLTCSADEDIVIDSNGDVYCEKHKDENNTQDDNSVNDNNNNDTADDTSDNNGDSSNNSNDRDDNKDEGNKKNCSVNLCNRYKNPQLGDSWTQQGNCWIWLNAPSNCPNKVCINQGNCLVPNSGSSSSSNSNNIDLSGLINQQKITNNKLSSINKVLEDIKNLKPDSNFNPDGYNEDTTDYSSFSQYIDNAKDLISNLVSSVDNLKNLLENPKEITLFNEYSSYACPLNVNLYSKSITLDICEFVSPYRPILSLFFTLFFSFQVFFMFFKHVLKGGE